MKQFAASTLSYGEQTRLPLEQQACADPTDSRWCSARPAAAYADPRSLRVAVFDDIVALTSPARRNGALSRDSGSQLAHRLRPKSPGEPRPPRSVGHTPVSGQLGSGCPPSWRGGEGPPPSFTSALWAAAALRPVLFSPISVLRRLLRQCAGSTQAHRSPPILRSLPSFLALDITQEVRRRGRTQLSRTFARVNHERVDMPLRDRPRARILLGDSQGVILNHRARVYHLE